MKQIVYYIVALVLLLAVCCAIIVGRRQPAAPPTETNGVTDPQRPSTVTSPGPESPASGTDLYLPEPLSAEAQEALDGLYERLRSEDCLCALAYLGTVPGETPLAEYLERSGLLTELAEQGDAYRFLPELTPAQCAAGGFTMLYCLVQQSDCAGVRIRAGDKTLYRREACVPVLFTADGGGGQLSITTAVGETRDISLTPRADGSFAPQPGLLDFTQ